MLYSLNGGYPGKLPDRIRFPDGNTRTDKGSFTAEEIAAAGYVAVSDKPEDTETTTSYWDSTISDWVVRDKTLDELEFDLEQAKLAKITQVEKLRDMCFAGGFSIESGTMTGEILQVSTLKDRTDWLTSQAAYGAAIAGGYGAVADAKFRPMSNITYTLTYSEGYQVLLDMAAWGKTLMNNSWILKDAIRAATTLEEVNAIDISVGWPTA